MTKRRYCISVDSDTCPSWSDYADRIFVLKDEVEALLLANGLDPETHFLEEAEPQDGSVSVLLECTEDFLEKVKALPSFYSVVELEPAEKTITLGEYLEKQKRSTHPKFNDPNP